MGQNQTKNTLYELFRPYLNKDLVIGYFRVIPGLVGCFEHKDTWYLYEVDEKEYTITGPFSDYDIIYALAVKLGVSGDFNGFKFSDTAQDIYLHSHFHNINDLP